jgi:hypothetical protein
MELSAEAVEDLRGVELRDLAQDRPVALVAGVIAEGKPLAEP